MKHPKEFFDQYKDAAFRKDKSAMKALYHEMAVLFDVWNDFSIRGKLDVCRMVDEWFDSLGSESVGVEFEGVQLLVGDTVAFASCSVTFRAISESGEELRHITERMTLGFVKESD